VSPEIDTDDPKPSFEMVPDPRSSASCFQLPEVAGVLELDVEVEPGLEQALRIVASTRMPTTAKVEDLTRLSLIMSASSYRTSAPAQRAE
jgi:hypothetical protein